MTRIRTLAELNCTWRFERQAYQKGYERVAGCDEAGRGALIGPLYAAAVILDPQKPITGLNDSKKLAPTVRERLAVEIRAKAIAFQVVAVSAREVDTLNVYQASRLAMIRALHALKPPPQFILTDAMRLWVVSPGTEALAPFLMLVHGDARSVSIAAASILAKVERDEALRELDRRYPQYSLAQNKGYATAEHLRSLLRYGPCPEHRQSFQPVRACCQTALDFGS